MRFPTARWGWRMDGCPFWWYIQTSWAAGRSLHVGDTHKRLMMTDEGWRRIVGDRHCLRNILMNSAACLSKSCCVFATQSWTQQPYSFHGCCLQLWIAQCVFLDQWFVSSALLNRLVGDGDKNKRLLVMHEISYGGLRSRRMDGHVGDIQTTVDCWDVGRRAKKSIHENGCWWYKQTTGDGWGGGRRAEKLIHEEWFWPILLAERSNEI